MARLDRLLGSLAIVAVSHAAACSAEDKTTASSTTGIGGTSASTTDATVGAGAGGAGGSIDHGMPSDVYPAFHPTLPTVIKGSGQVIAAPVFIPIYFANDDTALTGKLTTFAAGLGATPYWAKTTTEYGVGPATSLAPVQLSENAPTTIDDEAIKTWLGAKLNANDPAFPVPDDDSIFLIKYPMGTTVTIQGETSCVNSDAYHNSFKLDAAHGSRTIPYAVVPTCGNFGFSLLDEVTVAASHELIEAATDPDPFGAYAYDQLDPDHFIWALFTNQEVCDLCDFSKSSYTKLPGFDYLVERCYSNEAATALHDPCAPADGAAPYFNSAAVVNDKVHYQGLTFPGLTVPVGQTKDLELDLFSFGKTSGPWTVTLEDLAPTFGNPVELDLVLDRPSGVNGEKLHVSVTAKKKAKNGFSIFVVRSVLGDQQNVWVVPVGNQ